MNIRAGNRTAEITKPDERDPWAGMARHRCSLKRAGARLRAIA